MASSSGTQNVQATIASVSVGIADVAKNGRGMKTDQAWEHGVMIDEATKRVGCNYCRQEFTKGAYRLKHHLAGSSKNDKSCKLVPDDVKKAMEDIVCGLQKKLLKKHWIDIEGDVAEAKIAADSNGKRKSPIFTLTHDRMTMLQNIV
jgi:hypothetical protein